MMEIDESIRAMVYCHFSTKGDFLMSVYENEPGKFIVKGRVRWYREDTGDPFEDKDEKQWIISRHPVSYKEQMENIDSAIAQMRESAKRFGFEVTEEKTFKAERKAGEPLEEFTKKFFDQPFVHRRVLDEKTGDISRIQ